MNGMGDLSDTISLYELKLDSADSGDTDCGEVACTDGSSLSVAHTADNIDTASSSQVVRASTDFTMQALKAVADIDAALFPGNVWGLVAYTNSAIQAYDYLLVSADGEDITGFALLRCMDDAELIRIAVRPDCRRQGYGRRMLNALTEEIHKRDIHSLFLEVRSSNKAAISLYESAGFEEVGVRKAYYAAPREDAVIMRYTW